MKYITVSISNVITSIAKPTEIEGYTIGVLEAHLPDDTETDKWSTKQSNEWIIANNKRMKAICKFLNDNDL